MSKFLGIEYNKWHGVIPLVVVPVVMVLNKLIFGANQKTGVLIYFGLMTLLTILQYFNELFQSLDPDVIDKYGSIENFRLNSKEDWKWFILGGFAGSALGWILYVVV